MGGCVVRRESQERGSRENDYSGHSGPITSYDGWFGEAGGTASI